MEARGCGRGGNESNRGRGRSGRGGGFDGGRGGGYYGGRGGGFDGGRGGGYYGGRGGGHNGGRGGGYEGGRGGGRGRGFNAGRGGGYNVGRGGYDGGRGGYSGGRGGGYNAGRGGYNQQVQQYNQQPQQWATSGPNWGPASGEGSSSGQQPKLSGDEYAEKLRQLSSQSTDDRGLVCKIQSMKLSGKSPQIGNTVEKVPVKRPDKGGVAKIRTVNILVNHFPVQFNPETVIRHYDIDIKPEVAPTRGRPLKMSKANLSLAMEKLFSDNPDFPVEMTAFDGEKNIFSAVPLPTGTITVTLPPQEDVRCHTYKFSVSLVNELKLHKLKDYLTGKLLQLPREVLQGMDIVMKENPRRHLVSIGKSFHPIDPTDSPLHYGLVASEGFQHSLKPTSQGLALCLDYSVLAVRKRVSVLQFLEEHIELTEVNSNSFRRMRGYIEDALKGLKVTVTHRRTKQKYVISGLSNQNACDICFTVEDPDGLLPPRNVRLLDYFQEKYPGVDIEHGDIPCLSLGKGMRANYVPIELCVLVEGQRFPKDSLDHESAIMLKNMSLVSPSARRSKICSMLRHDHGPSRGEICRNFGFDVVMNMTQVKGRVIEPPKLKLRSSHNEVTAVNVLKESCQWNLVDKKVIEGTSLVHWAVLDLSSNGRYDRLNPSFIENLVARCRKLGMHMEFPLFTENAFMRDLRSAESLTPLLERVQYKAREDYQVKLQLILCVMTKKDPGYKYIKWVAEKKIGVVTQCCLSKIKIANKGQDQYLAQLGMKINVKLGGSNVELLNQSLFREEDHVMLIGADVNHPRPGDFGSPSIAAVVASMNWPAANKYIPRVCPQDHRVEEIIGFGLICRELIECYEKLNGVKPQKLVIFRDGVSEGQFDMVLNRELLDLDSVLENIADYNPTITLIVAQKRHQTRLFPKSEQDAGKTGNVPPGTVVDTTIVHSQEFDFYLCSHNGSIGTSKPTHYHVLFDEHKFSSDQWQKFIYDLCFIYARCCKPVSLVPPVYYADLLAYRGRLHYDARSDAHSSSGNSSSGYSSSSSAMSASTFATLIENPFHVDIMNFMFFI